MSAEPARVTWWGHASALIEMDGARIVTDPVLTARAVHLRRRAASIATGQHCDAVLISHLHMDHLHLRSLRLLRAERVIGPAGLAAVLSHARWAPVTELSPGERIEVGGVEIEAVPAEHDARRLPWASPTPALGFVLRGSRSVYFAGDTGPFDEMTRVVPSGLDAVLLPIWGWGPKLGHGHLDPLAAARILRQLEPSAAVPIHWGTYAPIWTSRRSPPAFLSRPVVDFHAHAGRLAPGVRVAALRPGGPGLILP